MIPKSDNTQNSDSKKGEFGRLCYSFVVVNIEAPVVENRHYPNGSAIFRARAPEIAKSALPGQFVMAGVATKGGLPSPLLKRALAVYSLHPKGEDLVEDISFLVKVVGEGTQRLADVKEGDFIELIGPLGNGFDLTLAKGKLNFLVVGGTGVASVLLLAEKLCQSGEEVHLVYGGRTEKDLIGLGDFTRLDIPIYLTTEDGSRGFAGLVTDGFRDYLSEFPQNLCNIYTCGPNLMMEAVTRIAAKKGISCEISVEAKMACGFGVCLGCTVKTTGSYRLACTHGPVFDAAHFIWEPGKVDYVRES